MEKITFKSMLFRNFLFFKIALFEIARKAQILRILRGKLNENVIFCEQRFFQKKKVLKKFFLQNRVF